MTERPLFRPGRVRRWGRVAHPRAAAVGGIAVAATVAAAALHGRNAPQASAPEPAGEIRTVRVVAIESDRTRVAAAPVALPALPAAVGSLPAPASPIDTDLALLPSLPAPGDAGAALPPPRPGPADAPAYAGLWAPHPDACLKGKRGTLLPVRIDRDAARAGGAACRFDRVLGDGPAWRVVASCADGGSRWQANVRIALDGDRLVWSSEKGVQTYTRCAPTRTASAD